MLAFALASGSGNVIYEVLNLPEPATCVFPGELAAINRALDDARFRAERTVFTACSNGVGLGGAKGAGWRIPLLGRVRKYPASFREGAGIRCHSCHGVRDWVSPHP